MMGGVFMKSLLRILLMVVALGVFTSVAEARKDVEDFSIKGAKTLPEWSSEIRKDIPLYFGDKSHPRVARSYGEYSTNKKTNAFNKSDKVACEWAFLSAVLQLQRKAAQLGGDAVINIKSNYNRNETSSTKTFKCAVGNIIAGVALKGTVVKLKK